MSDGQVEFENVDEREGDSEASSVFGSVHTSNFPRILEEVGSSLAVTTYQAGRLLMVRSIGGRLNTHFAAFDKPMGVSYDDGRLALGTRNQVWRYQSTPEVPADGGDPRDASTTFLPRFVRWTGDIAVHDVAWVQDQLVVVATRFSCLATLSDDASFVPLWKPRFISELAGEDRCHLNGLAVRDGRATHVTAFAPTDSATGWREHHADRGVLVDVHTGRVVLEGMSMPHSPRWHRNSLWMLESGRGALLQVDPKRGHARTVVEVPGFARGLAFAGPYAFIGLSKVRETSTFGGIPLESQVEERQCGVWVADLERATIVGFLRFEDVVQEIYDVAVLPGVRFPELADLGSDLVDTVMFVP